MRIGVVTTSYPRFAGDPAGHFVAGLNRYLVRRGHSVEVLAAGDSAVGGERDESGLSVLRVPSSLFYRGGAPEAMFGALAGSLAAATGSRTAVLGEALRFSGGLGRLLASRLAGYDALVSHWLLPCGLLAALLGGDRPQVAIAHSSDVHLLRRLRLGWLGRLIARRARLVYSHSALRLPGADGVVVPMGIDCAAFLGSPAQRSAARQRLGATGPTVLFLGRLVPVKGVGLLLAALVRRPELSLWLAGDGPLRLELEQQAVALGLERRVRFFGELHGAARCDLLWAADVLAVPSLQLRDGRTEGAPQVVLEGLAAGCQVVASAVGGVAELVGEAGWLVAPDDVLALAAQLGEAARAAAGSDGERRQRQGLERAWRYDWAEVAPQILGPLLSSPRAE